MRHHNDDTHNLHRPPAKTYRSGDRLDERRAARTVATIIFWLFWIGLGVIIAALDVSVIRHRPDNIDTPQGWAQICAMTVTFMAVVSALTALFRWAARNRYK